MDLPVYFISDTHLLLDESGAEQIRREKLYRFLGHVKETGGTLFIVGDMFDFYFEYQHVIPKIYFDFFHELYTLKKSGTEIHYVLGNHDYWVMDFITGKLTTKTYFEDTSFSLNGKSFYVTHGDGHLSWDRGYRVLKAVIQSRPFTWLYRWIHPTLGYRFANWISKRGKHYDHSEEYNRRVLEEMKNFAEIQTTNGSDYVVSGHYHQAVVENVKDGKLVLLGDWISYFTYGLFDGHDLTLKTWEANA